MKPWIALSGIILLGCAAIVVSERQRVDTPASADAVLHLVGDTEQEISRLPMKLTRISDAEEIRIGNQLAKSYAEGWKPTDEQKAEFTEVEAYLNLVGARVAANAQRKLPYRFHYIPDEGFINAFALPGGHIFVGAGLLALMDSEDELAAVLGHEVEHVDLYHCAERVQVEARLHRVHLEVLGDLIAIPSAVFEAGYSKEQELAADRDGTRIAVQANYSAMGAVRLFEVFQVLENIRRRAPSSPQQELSQVALQTLEGYFRSHPPSAEREQSIKDLIATEGWPAKAETNLAASYIYWTHEAERVYRATKYDRAIGLAQRALASRANYPAALQVLGDATFYSARFAEAAAAYRSRLQHSTSLPLARRYAETLAAREPAAAGAREYGDWLHNNGMTLSFEFELELTGLKLLAGDEASAQKLAGQLRLAGADPQARGRLGWWYYRAGRYDVAQSLLDSAVEERPQSSELKAALGWAVIESRQFETALTRFNQADEVLDNRMGRAVVLWQVKAPDESVNLYISTTAAAPCWQNPRWISATQSPLVTKVIAEIENERKAREKKHREAAQKKN